MSQDFKETLVDEKKRKRMKAILVPLNGANKASHRHAFY
jgi:hypothetical protein